MDHYEDGDNPLHWAAFWGDRGTVSLFCRALPPDDIKAEIVQLHLEAGADISMKNRFGLTPIEDAYRRPT